MAGIGIKVQTPAITTGTSLKTLLQLVAPTNQRVKVRHISVSFNGIANTDAPIKVEVLRQTDAGAMTALTPKKSNKGDPETLQTTAQHTATTEPTADDILLTEYVHPQTGYSWPALYPEDIIAVYGGTRLGLRVTAGVSVSAVARMEGEE